MKMTRGTEFNTLDPMKSTVRGMLKKQVPKQRTEDAGWSLVKDKYETAMDLRRPFDQQWLLDIAFFVGRQYTFFNSSQWLLQQLKEVKGRIRNVDNQLLPRVRRQISNGLRNMPTMSVVPSTNDEEDIQAARMGDKFLKSFWQTTRMIRKNRQLRTWMHVCGNGFVLDFWNPKIGPVERDATGLLKYQGDADLEVLGPLNIGVPFSSLGDADLQDFPWLIISKVKTLEWLANNYERGKLVTEESIPGLYFETSQLFGLSSGAAKEKVRQALWHRLFILPSPDFPNGLEVHAANGTILKSVMFPYSKYPISHFKDIDMPGIFWGMSTMHQGIGLQKTWNRTISSFDEFNRMMGKGKGLVPKGAELQALPDDTHGEWLSYKPVMGIKPEIMTLKGLPDSYDKILAVTKTSLEDLFSQHEVTRGTNKSDLRSGEMVSLLLEQDAYGDVVSNSSFEEGIEETMSRVLQRVAAGYTTQRMLKLRGSDGEMEIVAFKGADLRSNTDVSVKKDSALPESRSVREQLVLEKFSQGLYGDPADPEVRRNVMNMLDDAVVKDIYADTRLDEANARVENQTIMQGGIDQILVNQYDDHMLHIKEHTHFMKKRQFQQLKANMRFFAQVQFIFLQHLQQHRQFAAEMLAQQQKSMEATGGKVRSIGERSRSGGSAKGNQ